MLAGPLVGWLAGWRMQAHFAGAFLSGYATGSAAAIWEYAKVLQSQGHTSAVWRRVPTAAAGAGANVVAAGGPGSGGGGGVSAAAGAAAAGTSPGAASPGAAGHVQQRPLGGRATASPWAIVQTAVRTENGRSLLRRLHAAGVRNAVFDSVFFGTHFLFSQ